MIGIPEGLIVQAQGWERTTNANVMKPTFGSMGSQFVEFKVHKEYSGADSVKANVEVNRHVEICLIQNDKFSKVPLRMNELSPKQKIELSQMYERFKSQKDSSDTSVLDWDALTYDEKAFLGSAGIWTVEQLHSLGEHEQYKLGPAYADLKERAKRHIDSKPGSKVAERKREMELLMEEKRKDRERIKELEDRLFRLEETKAAAGKKKPTAGRTQVKVSDAPLEQAA